MGVQALKEVSARLIREGLPSTTPAALVLDAGGPCQRIVSAALADIAAAAPGTQLPGLLLVGETANPAYLYRYHGALRGRRIWLTCSRDAQERAARAVVDYGGVPVRQPLIELVPEPLPTLAGYDWLILTSPSAVRCCLSQVGDVRTLPRILCCGEGTAAALALFRVTADAMPDGDFSTEGVLRTAQRVIPATARVCRLRSDRAGSGLSARLRPSFACVDDVVVCRNRPVRCDLPGFDAVFLASASAVDSLVEQFGTDALCEKYVVVIVARDAAALRRHGIENAIAPLRSTVEDAIATYADRCVAREMPTKT
jgi:uroporphyrinogen-III synthase